MPGSQYLGTDAQGSLPGGQFPGSNSQESLFGDQYWLVLTDMGDFDCYQWPPHCQGYKFTPL